MNKCKNYTLECNLNSNAIGSLTQILPNSSASTHAGVQSHWKNTGQLIQIQAYSPFESSQDSNGKVMASLIQESPLDSAQGPIKVGTYSVILLHGEIAQIKVKMLFLLTVILWFYS